MKLLPLLWLLCGLLLVVGDQDPPVAPAPAPKASIADNSTVAAQGKPTSAAAPSGATGTPLPPAGSAAGKVQTSDQSVPKATKIEPKEADKTPAASENAGKNRGRTDTGSPKAAGEAPVAASTAKPAVVESKASTAAAGAEAAAGSPSAASPKPNSNDTAPVSSTSTKASTPTSTTTTAKPAAGSAIVSEGQSMKDVTKPTNSSTNSSTTSTMASTKTTIKTTPKPTKPPVVYSMGTHSEWEKGQEQGKDGGKPLPLPKPVSTLAEPVAPQVQELTGNLSDRGDTGYVVPIVTVLLTVPLVIGVVTIMYRRFRDMWSTRHYRRMDFLVDGMYND